jgi:hypothetical protein
MDRKLQDLIQMKINANNKHAYGDFTINPMDDMRFSFSGATNYHGNPDGGRTSAFLDLGRGKNLEFIYDPRQVKGVGSGMRVGDQYMQGKNTYSIPQEYVGIKYTQPLKSSFLGKLFGY